MMLKQVSTRLGLAGSFSKMKHIMLLLHHENITQAQLRQISRTAKKFSAYSEKKSRPPLFEKDQLSEWTDWMNGRREGHSSQNESHVTEELGCPGNKLHVPVMVEEVKEIFGELMPKTVLDMTFGAGGHSRALLDHLPDCVVLALDRDPYAHKLAQELAEERPGKVIPLLGRFSDLSTVLSEVNIAPGSIDGALFDLGSSSMQFDQAERGFSLSRNGPLDMRMDGDRFPGQPTAADVVNLLSEFDLAKILKKYGDEARAKKIAHGIVNARAAFGKITTTQQLADIINSIFPGAYTRDSLNRNAHTATKTFQALRIFVNNEINELHNGLEIVHRYLRTGGICVAISFHSLEDRIVKRLFHDIDADLENNISIHKRSKLSSGSTVFTKEELEKVTKKTKWEPLTRKVTLPSVKEVFENPRSRSAKLRAAYKL